MGDALLVRKTGGGSAELPAIYVTYPEGSICTCSKGSKTYTAKDTSGYWLFAGLAVGTWTVTISDPTGTYEDRSATATITVPEEVVNVSLSYRLYLYQSGNQYTDITGGFAKGYSAGVAPTITFNATNIYMRGVGSDYYGSNGSIATQSAIDVTNYATMYFKVSQVNFGGGNATSLKFGLDTNPAADFASYDYLETHSNPANGFLTMNVSGATGSYFVGIGGEGNANYSWAFAVEEIFME